MRWILILSILISFNGYSQWSSYIIGIKGDTLNCVDKAGLRQGRWVVRYDEVRGEKGYEEEGIYVDGKKEGLWRQYSLEGDLIAAENYRWGNKNGVCQYYTRNGELLREEGWRAVNPLNPYDTVEVADWEKDPLGLITKTVVVKLEGSSVKHGQWKYYEPQTGYVVKTETYVLGTLDNGPKKDLTNVEDPEKKKQVAKPKEVLDFEKKNSGKKKIKVRDGSTGGGR
jgi:hypothetical protein